MFEEYRSITEKILEIVSNKEVDDIKLAFNLQRRKELIDRLQGIELDRFRERYKNEIHDIDEKIKAKLNEQILSVKKEIKNFNINKLGNSAYVNMNKNNLNIFYKKV